MVNLWLDLLIGELKNYKSKWINHRFQVDFKGCKYLISNVAIFFNLVSFSGIPFFEE